MEQPDISVVIISWNTRELLRDCLRSVYSEPTGLALEVFVADNQSSDGSADMVQREFPQVRLIRNESNLGFAVANNRVFPLCRADAILLLNSDTIVQADALRVLHTFLQTHPEVGAVGPKLLHPHAGLKVLGCGQQATLRATVNHWLFLSRLFPHVRAFEGIHHFVGLHDKAPRSVGWVSGACMMVRRAVLDEVGPLSERWFMYAEDQEWCARMIGAGWPVFHVPEAVVEHHLSASTAQNAEVSLLPFTAGRDLFIQRMRPSRLQLWIYDFSRAVGLAIRSAGYFVAGSLSKGRHAMWRSRSRAFWRYATVAITYCGPARFR